MTRLDYVFRHHFKYSAQHNRQTHVIAFKVFRSTFTWQTSCFTIADKIKRFAIPSHPIQWAKSACEVGNICERPASYLISFWEGIHVHTHTNIHTRVQFHLLIWGRESGRALPPSLARSLGHQLVSDRPFPSDACAILLTSCSRKLINQRRWASHLAVNIGTCHFLEENPMLWFN